MGSSLHCGSWSFRRILPRTLHARNDRGPPGAERKIQTDGQLSREAGESHRLLRLERRRGQHRPDLRQPPRPVLALQMGLYQVQVQGHADQGHRHEELLEQREHWHRAVCWRFRQEQFWRPLYDGIHGRYREEPVTSSVGVRSQFPVSSARVCLSRISIQPAVAAKRTMERPGSPDG